MKRPYLTLFLIFAVIVVIAFTCAGCTKDDIKDWQLIQVRVIYGRTKCSIDSATNKWPEIAKTSEEVSVIIREHTYQKWMQRSDLDTMKMYQGINLPDSLWVESNCRSGYYVCVKSVEKNK